MRVSDTTLVGRGASWHSPVDPPQFASCHDYEGIPSLALRCFQNALFSSPLRDHGVDGLSFASFSGTQLC
jgi:hypothetical protein